MEIKINYLAGAITLLAGLLIVGLAAVIGNQNLAVSSLIRSSAASPVPEIHCGAPYCRPDQTLICPATARNGCGCYCGAKAQPTPTTTDVNCLAVYDPVCGVDGKTYGNDCEAEQRYGVAVVHRGACEEAVTATCYDRAILACETAAPRCLLPARRVVSCSDSQCGAGPCVRSTPSPSTAAPDRATAAVPPTAVPTPSLVCGAPLCQSGEVLSCSNPSDSCSCACVAQLRTVVSTTLPATPAASERAVATVVPVDDDGFLPVSDSVTGAPNPSVVSTTTIPSALTPTVTPPALPERTTVWQGIKNRVGSSFQYIRQLLTELFS